MQKSVFASLCLCFLIVLPFRGALAYVRDYNVLLKAYVVPVERGGIRYNSVDYNSWAQDLRHQKAMESLLEIDTSLLVTQEEKLAFWINAYNLLTVDLIIQTGEQDSIKNQGSPLKTPRKTFKWLVGGKEYTLDAIEYGIIRPLGDPRVHFALNGASKSCPDLRQEAYTPSKLNAQLDDQVKKTFTNVTKGMDFRRDKNVLRVSKIMDWHKSDFNGGDLRSWLKPYVSKDMNEETEIGFFEYDWTLNSR